MILNTNQTSSVDVNYRADLKHQANLYNKCSWQICAPDTDAQFFCIQAAIHQSAQKLAITWDGIQGCQTHTDATPIMMTGFRPYLSAAMPHNTAVANRPTIKADPEIDTFSTIRIMDEA